MRCGVSRKGSDEGSLFALTIITVALAIIFIEDGQQVAGSKAPCRNLGSIGAGIARKNDCRSMPTLSATRAVLPPLRAPLERGPRAVIGTGPMKVARPAAAWSLQQHERRLRG